MASHDLSWCGNWSSKNGMVAVYLDHCSNKRIEVQFGFNIRDKEGNLTKDYPLPSSERILFSPNGIRSNWGSPNFCERSTIIDSLVDGALIIEVRMRQPTTKATDNSGGKKHTTSNKQSAQQSAHKSKKKLLLRTILSSPLSRRCERKCKLKTHHQLIILFMSTYLADLLFY